jgi:hypothetical protein
MAWCPNCGTKGGEPDQSAGLYRWALICFGAFAVLFLAFYLSQRRPVTASVPPPATAPSTAFLAATTQPASSSSLGSGSQDGPFTVFDSRMKRPSIRISNTSDLYMRLALRGKGGYLKVMDIPPQSEKAMDADVGDFTAEVYDPQGITRSAVGDASFHEFHEYRAGFGVGSNVDNSFHIGD